MNKKNWVAFIKNADALKLPESRSTRVFATTLLSFLLFSYVNKSHADIILSGDIATGTGVMTFTTDYTFNITSNSSMRVLIFEGWGFPPDDAEDGVQGTDAIKVEVNGVDAEIRRFQFYDNLPVDGGDFSAGDSYWFLSPTTGVLVGDVVTIRSGSTPLTLTPYWNPAVSGAFTGNLFLTNGDGIRISDVVSAIPEPIAVTIDIKPSKEINKINLSKKRKLLPVAVLGSVGFDATQVDFSTVRFGPGNAPPAHQGHVKDVNGDGYVDMKFHFKTRQAGIECGDKEASLTGETFDSVAIAGTDTIETVKCD